MDRLRQWWASLSGPQQLILGAGVPAAAIAALVANLRDRETAEGAEENGDGVEGPSRPLDDFMPDNVDLLVALESSRLELRRDFERALTETEARIRGDLGGAAGGGGGGSEDETDEFLGLLNEDGRLVDLTGEQRDTLLRTLGTDEGRRLINLPGIRPTGEDEGVA